MKKHIIAIYCIALIVSCSKDSSGPDMPPTPANEAPSKPSLLEPTNNKLCINNTVFFKWSSSTDPDGDAIKYQLQVSEDRQFSQIAHTFNQSSTSKSIELDKGETFYWRVKSSDSSLSSDYSTVYSLYTEGVGQSNHAPFAPELVAPVLRSIAPVGTTTLEWTANDVDVEDILSYDVYYGTNNPPTSKIGDGQSEKSLNVTSLAATNYFWYVVVKDNNGSETTGQIWDFKTE